jgi:hypothetical protein
MQDSQDGGCCCKPDNCQGKNEDPDPLRLDSKVGKVSLLIHP